MKKGSKIILSVLVVIIVLCVVYRLVNKAPSADLKSNAQMEQIVASSGCTRPIRSCLSMPTSR